MRPSDAKKAIDDACRQVIDHLPGDQALAAWADRYARRHRKRLADDLMIIDERCPLEAKVIEFGAAPYILTIALQRRGHRVHAVDIAPDRFGRLIEQCGLTVYSVDFEKQSVPFDDDTFDVILFNEVFEHLRLDLIATMTEVRRVLKPDGILFLSTPNHRSLVGIWTLLWHQFSCHVEPDVYLEYEKLRRFGHMGHVREYTAREVSVFLRKIGLETMETIFRYFGPGADSMLSQTRWMIERSVGAVLPGLRPLFSLVCRKISVPHRALDDAGLQGRV